MKISTRMAVALITLVLAAAPALASGFHVYEQGAKASGQAVAFVARADNASAAWYNPAAAAHNEGMQVGAGFSLVFLGDTTFNSRMDEVPGLPPGFMDGGSFEMESNVATPAHFHFTHNYEGSPWAVTASLTSPFGLVTEWADDFDGRFAARKSDLRILMLNFNGAYDLGGGWAVAAGLDYVFVDLKDFSSNVPLALNFGSAGVFDEPLKNLVADGTELTWNAAVHYVNDNWAFGASYRAGADVTADGEVEMSGVPAGNIPGTSVPWASQLRTISASGELRLPATIAVGIAYLGVENWEFELDMHQINWSSFDELPIDLDEETSLMQDSVVPEHWVDAKTWRFGAAYDLNERNQLRFGVYTDETAIPIEYLRPSVPDSDRTGYTLGYGYVSPSKRFAIDAYWLHIVADDATTTFELSMPNKASTIEEVITSTPWGTYETTIDLIGVTLNWRL